MNAADPRKSNGQAEHSLKRTRSGTLIKVSPVALC